MSVWNPLLWGWGLFDGGIELLVVVENNLSLGEMCQQNLGYFVIYKLVLKNRDHILQEFVLVFILTALYVSYSGITRKYVKIFIKYLQFP